jgi:uncharacterized membrane protein
VVELPEDSRIAKVLSLLTKVHKEIKAMAVSLDNLTAQVAATKGVAQSAIVLIEGLVQRIIDAGTDPAALDALTASLKADTDALAAAVAAVPPA